MTNDITIHRIEPFRTRDTLGTIARIYRDAYAYPDQDAMRFINGAFARHMTWPGFTLLVATLETIPVGFIYGYETSPGQWWYDTIRPAMQQAGVANWQDGAFELAEIAVDPAVQRRGIGSTLIEAFLTAVEIYPAVLLSADMDEGHGAAALYRRFGFIDLVPGFQYPGFDDRAVLMGRAAP